MAALTIRSIRTKIILALVGSGLLAALVVGSVSHIISRYEAFNDAERKLGVSTGPRITALEGLSDSILDDLGFIANLPDTCLLYTSPSPRDQRGSRMPSSA